MTDDMGELEPAKRFLNVLLDQCAYLLRAGRCEDAYRVFAQWRRAGGRLDE